MNIMKDKDSLHRQQKLNIDKCPHLKRLETVTMCDSQNDEVYEEQACSQCGEILTPLMLEERKERLKKFNIYE